MSTIRPLVGSGQMAMFGGAAGAPATRPTRARADHPATRPMSRRSDPPTSNGAAVYAMPNMTDNRRKALAALAAAGADGLTDFELETATKVKQTSIGKRRLDLQDAGFVAPLIVDGKQIRRLAPSGALSGVYVITPAGIAHHRNQPPAPPAGDEVADAATVTVRPADRGGDPSPDPAPETRSIGDTRPRPQRARG